MRMKRLFITILAATAFWQANAAEKSWPIDLPAALAQARAEHKVVLMDFNGSDWCPTCIKFRKEVLDSGQFQDYASKKVVVLDVDFPDKKPQSSELKKANADLKDKYKINEFPTLVVLDQNGKEIGRVDYEDDGPKAFIAKLEKVKAGK